MQEKILPKLFLSTLSVRRATAEHPDYKKDIRISIHALREESDDFAKAQAGIHHISIHALREESDALHRHQIQIHFISIHALREESDV